MIANLGEYVDEDEMEEMMKEADKDGARTEPPLPGVLLLIPTPFTPRCFPMYHVC